MPKNKDKSQGRIHIPSFSGLVNSVKHRFQRQSPQSSTNKNSTAADKADPTSADNAMADANLSPFPKYDLSKFKWNLPLGESTRAVRLIGGPEYIQTFWNRFDKGDQNLFFGVYVDLVSPVSDIKLKAAAKEAWSWLRFHIPTIASTTAVNDNDEGILVYNVAKTQQEVDEWVGRTLLEEKADKIDLDELRVRLGPKIIPDEHGDQTWLYVVTSGSTNSITKFGLLLHSHHTPLDGTGLKKTVNRYMKQLAKNLGGLDDVPKETLKWGTEASNLLPSCFEILGIDALPISPSSSAVPKNSDPYYAGLAECMTRLARSTPTAYGFKPIPKDEGIPITKREKILFTKEETDLLLKKLKPSGSLGTSKGFTVAQLTHATLAMITVADNPPSPETPKGLSMNCFGLVDATNRLAEPWCTREAYPGYCLAVSPMEFPVSLFQNEDGTAIPLDKNTLVKVLKYAKQAYAEQKAIPAILSMMAQAAEMLSVSLKAAFGAGVFPPNQCFHFSSDGRGEIYLDPTHFDSTGKPILDVTDFFTSLNHTNPAGFFRVSSWKGRLELSVDANINLVPPELSMQRLQKWKEFTLLIKDLDEKDYE